MRTSETFGILFWINRARATSKSENVIYARLTVTGQITNFSLKRKVKTQLWDGKLQRSKGKDPMNQDLNAFLDETYAELFQLYKELRQTPTPVTGELIKAHFLGTVKKQYSLEDIMEYHTDAMQGVLHPHTLRHYQTSQRYIRKFVREKLKREDIFLSELNYSFIVQFEAFLRAVVSEQRQMKISNNTIMKHLQRLRKLVTLAFHNEWLERDPFIKYKCKTEKKERAFLTQEELERIENFTTPIKRLETVRDFFVFSCYTGIAYGDMMRLQHKHVVLGIDDTPWVFTQRQKTKTPVKIPLLPKALELIQKYSGSKVGVYQEASLFPKMSNQNLNAYLKEIADLTEIYKPLTFHIARHTFATTVTLANGVPIETVSKLLGHSKLTTTQVYARVLEEKLGGDMKMLKQKLL
ncbi:Site-specific recombinase XerD [Pustulibacterium marinum]|uniref:Site-specific recombinase XerD n=1 Tax=Pustulibacterium marinum TaxID=1224947 RepID=A0A1I7IZ90_9FLAO|nr:site-specific integrase [Pustulibacterium marinum]SFU78238.1 Site-specific recombinase XerD [Pustulibacterium marinum]